MRRSADLDPASMMTSRTRQLRRRFALLPDAACQMPAEGLGGGAAAGAAAAAAAQGQAGAAGEGVRRRLVVRAVKKVRHVRAVVAAGAKKKRKGCLCER